MARPGTGVLFYLKNPKAEVSPIKCVFCYHYKQLYYYERKLSVETVFWNRKQQQAKETRLFPGHVELNMTLRNIATAILDCYRRFVNDNGRVPEVEELRELVIRKRGVGLPKEKPKPELMDFIAQFIQEAEEGKHLNLQTGKAVKVTTTLTYRQTYNLLSEFSKVKKWKLTFAAIDSSFHREFVHFLSREYIVPETGKSYMPNSVGKHIANLKTFLNNAFERKLTTNQDFRMKAFKVIREEVDHIYLTKEEIRELETMALRRYSMEERVRDLFLFACYTGLRISDLKRVSRQHIKHVGGEQYIEIEMKKTEKPVTIPLSEKLEAILEKYDKPYGPFFDRLHDQKVNDVIKEVAAASSLFHQEVLINSTENGRRISALIPKYQLITNHTARRTFATNAVLDGYPYSAVMLITGHKTEKAFLRYVKINGYDAIKMFKRHQQKFLPDHQIKPRQLRSVRKSR